MRPYHRVASLLPGLEFARKYQARMDLVGPSLFRDMLNYQSTRIVSQHFIFFLTYEQANKFECLSLASLSSLVQYNTIAL